MKPQKGSFEAKGISQQMCTEKQDEKEEIFVWALVGESEKETLWI